MVEGQKLKHKFKDKIHSKNFGTVDNEINSNNRHRKDNKWQQAF